MIKSLFFSGIALLTPLLSPALIAQQPAAAVQPQAAQPAPKGVIYTILQPAMDTVLTTLDGLKIDRWKKGSVREEAAKNVDSLTSDIHNRVPELVTSADSSPGSLSKAMPLVNHLDALYDVLLRVEEASRVVAPGEQITQLQQALLKLNGARKALDDQLESQAATQEKQIADLQAALKAQQDQAKAQIAKASENPCKPATPAGKRKKAAAARKAATPGTQKH